MSSAAQSLSILILFAAVGIASIATFALRHYREPGARGFALTGFSMACWSVVVSINIFPGKLLPRNLSTTLRIGLLAGIALGWLLFVLEYTRGERVQLRPLPVALALVVPAATVLLTATNSLHHLVVGAGTPAAVSGGTNIQWGPWYLVFMLFAFTVTVLPAGLLARELRAAHGVHRRQLLLLLTGWVISFVGAGDYLILGAIPDVPGYVRVAPFTFLISAGLFAFALFRHQLFGLVPVSRRTVVETMPDPVVAVDGDGTVVDLNPAARALFAPQERPSQSATPAETAADSDHGLSGGTAVGDGGVDSLTDGTGLSLSTLCADHPEILDHYETGEDAELAIDHGGTTRHFSVTSEGIRDGSAGTVILLRDVTELKRREQTLEETNQQLDRFASFVTHDLRNPLNVAQLSLETAETDSPQIEKAMDAHDRMAQMIEDVRELTRIDRESASFESVDLESEATLAWSQVRTDDASLTVEDGPVTADPEYLRHVFENLFRNAVEHSSTSPDSHAHQDAVEHSSTSPDSHTRQDAVEHGSTSPDSHAHQDAVEHGSPNSDADSPQESQEQNGLELWVGPLDDGGFYVEDNGPGIPESEREDVFEYGYSTDSDGSGLGLSIVQNVADIHGWDVSITEGSDGGARFEFE